MKHGLKGTMTAKELYDYFEEAKRIGMPIRDDIFAKDRSNGRRYSLYFLSQALTSELYLGTPELYLGTVFDIGVYTSSPCTTVSSNYKRPLAYISHLEPVASYRPIATADTALKIKNVIFNGPATIVYWSDGSKTVVKCQPGEVLDYEKGLAMAISKKMLGNCGSYYDEFKKWVPEEEYIETDFVTVCENIIKGLASIASKNEDEDENDKSI